MQAVAGTVPGTDGARLRTAFTASLLAHACLLALLPAWMAQQSAGSTAIETLSFAHLAHIRLERPAVAKSVPVAIPKTTHRERRITFAHVRAEMSVSRKSKPRPTPHAGSAGLLAAAPKDVMTQQTAPEFAQPPQTAAVPSQNRVAPQAATPAPQSSVSDRVVAGTGTNDRGGVLPFGAEQSPVLDPRVLAHLNALNVRVTLVVTVGDDGKTKSVAFHPPIDPKTEQRIQSILADADWDAAVCGGGVSCEGTATIKL